MPRPASILLWAAAFTVIGGSALILTNAHRVLGTSTAQTVQPIPIPTFALKPTPWKLSSHLSVDASQVDADAFILVDEDSGTILAGKNMAQQRSMASITKMMTAVLALEFAKPESLIEITPEAFQELPEDSALMGISTGEHYTVQELLNGMLLPSGNDAAQALALAVAGSQPRFVQMMNAKAKQLGMSHTHFTNPSGLDGPDHYATAEDLARLAHYFRSFSLLRQIAATPSTSLPYSDEHKQLDLQNFNTLITSYPGATGIKPGNTGEAGNCLVATATRNGHSLIGVLLNTPGRNTNMAKLFDLGFNSFSQ